MVTEALATAAAELTEMMDEGINLDVQPTSERRFRLRVTVDDAACAECLVPDDTLGAIASDTLRRHGIDVLEVAVEHAAAGAADS